jgi:hypothetical protein
MHIDNECAIFVKIYIVPEEREREREIHNIEERGGCTCIRKSRKG